MNRLAAFGLVVLASSTCSCRREAPHPNESPTLTAATLKGPITVMPNEIKWSDPPPGLPPGSQAAVVQGDPSVANAVFTLRAKMPAGYRIPPHTHGTDELVTVLSGTLLIGHGDKLDVEKMTLLPPAGFVSLPARHQHYAMAGATETIIQVHGVGPFSITYVNPADDPRNKPK